MPKIIMAALAVLALAGCTESYRTLPADQHQVVAVHDVAGQPKAAIFAAVQVWLASNLGKSNEAFQMQDKEAGILIGRIAIPKALGPGGGFSSDLKMSVRIDVKDGKYRSEYSDFLFSNQYGDRDVIPGSEHQAALKEARALDARLAEAVAGGAKPRDF